MAVSFRIVVLLIALAAFGFAFIVIDAPVQNELSPLANDHSDSQPAQNFLGILEGWWTNLALFVTIAAGAWGIKEAVYARRVG